MKHKTKQSFPSEGEAKLFGREETREHTARNLLAMGLLSHEQIAQATALPLSEVEKLAKAPC